MTVIGYTRLCAALETMSATHSISVVVVTESAFTAFNSAPEGNQDVVYRVL